MEKGEDNFIRENESRKKGLFKLTPYIDQEGLDNIHKFKYDGSDTGIFYKIFWNPLALWCVDHISENIAPNVITLLGFGFTVVPFTYCSLVFGTQIGNNAEQFPPWMILTIGVSYFLYRLLDEMDGK